MMIFEKLGLGLGLRSRVRVNLQGAPGALEYGHSSKNECLILLLKNCTNDIISIKIMVEYIKI